MDNLKVINIESNNRITAIEAWTLARAKAGYPMITARNLLSDDVLEMARHIGTLKVFQDRDWYLNRKLSDEALAQVLNADAESVMPGTMPNGGIKRQWQIIPAEDLSKLPKVSWLIPHLLVDKGVTVLFGAPSTYKSFVALDWALRISQKQNVIYTIYEGLTGYWQRIKAWQEHNKMGYQNLHMCIGNLAIMDLNHMNEFIEQMQTYKPALVVIDTLARAMTGMDENSSRDMGLFVDACEKIRQQANCAVLIVHHSNKAGIQERGSIALRGNVDAMIRQYLDDDVIVTECEKMKDAERFPTYYNQAVKKSVIIDGELFEVPVLVAADKVIRDVNNLSANQKKVIDILGLEIFGNGATVAEIQETIPELSRGAVNRVLSRLIEMNLVHQPNKRDPYKLTADGLLHLSDLTRMTRLSGMSGGANMPNRGEHAEHAEHASQTEHASHAKLKQKSIFANSRGVLTDD